MSKILIVDDEKSIRRTLGEFLREAGYAVVEAENAEVALGWLSEAAFDVVVSDIILPRINGVELLRRIQEVSPLVQVVMMTGEPTVETATESLRAGAVDYLFKPINKAAILRAVANAARIKSLEDTRRRLEEENQAHRENLERLVAERTARLRESEALYHSLVENVPQHIFRKDAEGHFTFGNKPFCKCLGRPLADIVGKTDRDFFPPALAERYRQSDRRVLETGQPFQDEEEHPQADGKTVFVYWIKTPLRNAAGQVVGVQGIAWDITERKQTEEKLRKLARAVDQSPASIVITDRCGNIEFVNPKFTQVTGYTAEAVLGKNPRLLKSDETSGEEYRQLWETITAGQEWRGEFRNKRKDGTLFWEAASISPIRDASGAITHFIAVKEDVTEQKLTQAKFLRAQRVESIGSLASGIAHDLNNILTPIILSAPMLQWDDSPGGRQQLAQTIESSAQRAVSIVKQLLSFARGKEGQKQPIQIRHLVRDMAKVAQETFPRSIRVEENCANDLWPVPADSTQIHQVLLNLCVNARDAMPEGGKLALGAENVRLDEQFVSIYPGMRPGPYVKLEVQDTGTGIPEEHQSHIFESFFTTKGEGVGTGLGLTTVHGIVRDHKGVISFATAPGKGTTFTIHLPAVPDAAAEEPPIQGSGQIPRGHGELVLVVDDETSICGTTRRTLERHGYSVLEAHDGIEGLAKFSAHQHEVRAVISDVMMPLMDGVTLSRAVKALAPRTPILISGGGLFGQPAAKAMRAFEGLGIRHILHKPHTADALLAALAEAIKAEPAQQAPGTPTQATDA